ncbi:hypothetical protein GF339_20760 [candidate division KSB3 bacterium]|uniref:Uncharacterized protein n=1 Tax=candidate division KSB3 bacterium TaxID=2044937 RepID=A0A9D5Q7M0_9BACT|nr:hypothetical protein [candidate division KSB3 bacterium]MBD3327030.1 hypothetical protein [candidate division KSB3 bacterium]
MDKYTPHLGHFALVEACAQPGCPVCFLRKDAVTTSLRMVLADYVDDPDLRQELCDSLGYCGKHAWMLPAIERGNLLTVAVMYQDILERELPKTLTSGEKQPSRGSLFHGIRQLFGGQKPASPSSSFPIQRQCPACKLGDDVETQALQLLLKALAKGDEEMQSALQESDGLCLPHLNRALELAKTDTSRELLLAFARETLAAIRHELGEFIRKHDYRFQHESIDEERYSWKRAMNLIAGTPEDVS